MSFSSGTANRTIKIALSPAEFQLLEAGPYLDRSMGSAPDSRVQDFEPDEWQREVLDHIDTRRSLFVVALISAGKTFIS
jgi:superfamily II RNA helicase